MQRILHIALLIMRFKYQFWVCYWPRTGPKLMALSRNQSLSLIHHGHKKRCRSSLLSLPVQSPSITLKPTVSPLKKPHFLSFIIFLIRLCYSSLLPLITSETSSSLKNKEYLCNHTSIHTLSLSVTILIKTPLRKCCNSIILLGKIS